MQRVQVAQQRRSIAAISFAIALFSTSAALAQSPEAEALFNEGDAEMAKGNTDKACDAFEASNKVEPRAGTMIRLGECREKQHKYASAWSQYKDALTRVKDPAKKQIATDRVAALEPRISYLTISVADDVRVDGLEIKRNGKLVDSALWNRALPIDGGVYKITGHAPGHEEWSTDAIVPDEAGKVSVEVPKFKDMKTLVVPPDKKELDKDPDEQTDTPSMFTGKRKIALALGGVGLVSIGAGVFLGIAAKGLEDDANKLCPDRSMCVDSAKANDMVDRGARDALFANIGYGVGIAALVGAGVLWFTGAPAPHESGSVAVVPHSRGFSIQVSF